jgi:8-oxo-dGTP pyrophosphatase MutT (NUDIX family)
MHGASAICLVNDGGLVLVSEDGERWGLPGGRPEGSETWEQTLVREMSEEACARVQEARLLGFGLGVCTSGPEAGLALVRSQWLAWVELLPWQPDHEIPYRRVVDAANWRSEVWIQEGYEPIFNRMFSEAGIAQSSR